MSEWFEIKAREDVEVSDDGKTLEVLFNTNEWGNQYVAIPIEFIMSAIVKNAMVPPQQTEGDLDK
jgi:hypothetical protein